MSAPSPASRVDLRASSTLALALLLTSLFAIGSCSESASPSPSETPDVVVDSGNPTPDPIVIELPEPTLTRLTKLQYTQTVHDLLGNDITPPPTLEPDPSIGGLQAIGASVTAISPRGVELYEEAALSLAKQVAESAVHRALIVPCEPTGPTDEECLGSFVSSMGPKTWRRPLTEEEFDTLVAIGLQASTTLDDFYGGIQYILVALLQSPYFLYRMELGEAAPEGEGPRQVTSYELATRLSYFLWNTTPDDTLLEAAASNALLSDNGLEEQVDRLLADPRVRPAVQNFFADWLHLYELDHLSKDPTIFKHYSAELGAMAREETLLLVDHLIFEKDADIRTLFTSQETFVNRRLAAIYNIAAPVEEGFGPVFLPEEGQRQGFLGQVSFLGLHSHPVSSSATLRGAFIRETLLCDPVPDPPADLNTAIPQPSSEALTLKERLVVHMEDPSCASCHAYIDVIGFGLESFDGIGRFRTLDNGGLIDPSGTLDGQDFANAMELSTLIAQNSKLSRCLTQRLYETATNHPFSSGELEQLEALVATFETGGYRIKDLLKAVIMSPGFRQAAEVTP